MYRIIDQIDLRDAVLRLAREYIQKHGLVIYKFANAIGSDKDFLRERENSTRLHNNTVNRICSSIPIEFRLVDGDEVVTAHNITEMLKAVGKLSKRRRSESGMGVVAFGDIVGSMYYAFENGRTMNQVIGLATCEHWGIKIYARLGEHTPGMPVEEIKQIATRKIDRPFQRTGNGKVVNGFTGW